MTLPSPRTAFRTVATAEAVTWFLLIVGMVLKYVTRTTELGVRVFGMLHGIVFISYVLVTIAVFGGAGLALLGIGRPGLAAGLVAAALLSSVLSTPPGAPHAAGAVVSPAASR